MLQVDYLNFGWLAFGFVAIYLVFVMPAAVVLPVVLLSPLLILKGFEKDENCGAYTKDACKLRREGGTCDQMMDTFKSDEEWKRYRFAVCNGLGQKASTAKLKNSYSEAAFNDCIAEASDIENIIDTFSTSDCGKEKDLDPSTAVINSLYGDWLFLTFGIVGVAVSFYFLSFRLGNKISIPESRKQDGSLGNE